MSTYVIRPTSLIAKDNALVGTNNAGSSFTTASNSQIASYLGDNSDITAVASSGNGSRFFQLTLGTPLIASDEFVARVSSSVRWSGGATGKFVGAAVYKRTQNVPAGVPSVAANGSLTRVTTELGYVASGWENANGSNLALAVALDGGTSGTRPILWDTWATVYTLRRATASPQATTWSTSTYAEVPVDVTATIGWEADTFQWQNLRRVTVEVRVESGGSGVGSGTLVATGTGDILFDATGTQTLEVAVDTPLPNGTYRVYARAIRYRENQTEVAADQIGVWSSGVTLTMTVNPPAAPTIAATVNTSQGRVELVVTAPTSAGYTSPFYTVERSDDLGVTWVQVRGLSAVNAAFGTPSLRYDYEAPRAVQVRYRARVSAYISGVLNTSVASAPVAVTVPIVEAWNIKCPQSPNLNVIGVTVVGNPSEGINEDIGVFRPFGRRYPVTVSGTLTGWDGEFDIITLNADEWSRLKALIESQLVLLVESPFGWRKYVRLSNGASVTMLGTAAAPRRRVSVSYVETSSPVGGFVAIDGQFTSSIDFGDASTTVWDETMDCGDASTTSFAPSVDGGQAA